jgi:hypothetical protein
VVAIDPGHSGRSITSIDRATGLRDVDYPNYSEIYEMFDVSHRVAEGLRADGYRVVLTKKRSMASVSLANRAEIATRSRADLAISVHNDHSQGPEFQATYDQRGRRDPDGGYHAMYRGTGANRTVFDHPAIARRSQRYAKIIARARTETQGRAVGVRENSFDGRPPLEPGNLALVQLLAEVPWVYNEMGARTGGYVSTAISILEETRYAQGLLLGVERAVPSAAGVVDQPSPGFRGLRRCLVKRVEPHDGVYSRPEAYLPDGFAR